VLAAVLPSCLLTKIDVENSTEDQLSMLGKLALVSSLKERMDLMIGGLAIARAG